MLVLLALSLLGSGCGVGNQLESAVGGRVTKHRVADGVRCYESQGGSLSRVVVK